MLLRLQVLKSDIVWLLETAKFECHKIFNMYSSFLLRRLFLIWPKNAFLPKKHTLLLVAVVHISYSE